MSQRYTFEDLKYLMSRLRDKDDGCPWDIDQTFETIVPHTLEEVYEVIDTIERRDFDHLSEELGDLLFQVVFYAQIADEDDRFDLDQVVHELVSKLIYRHPHVFPAGTLESRADKNRLLNHEVSRQWEELKSAEKRKQGAHVLADVPVALPGLLRAKKLQKKAAKVGFDWPDVTAVLTKVDEEILELKEAIAAGNQQHIEEELGDVLFVLANVARHLHIDPEQAVRRTNQKFEARFAFVEQQVGQSGQPWSDFTLEQLDGFWTQAKEKSRS